MDCSPNSPAAVKAFLDDLTAAKLAERVGRDVFQRVRPTRGRERLGGNRPRHRRPGHARRTWRPKPGVHGSVPSLTDLVDGDPKITTDFRQVYAALLENWLSLPSRAALGARFEPLRIL